MAENILSDHRHRQPPPDESTAADTDPLPIPPDESTNEIFDFDLPDIDLKLFDELESFLLSENENFSFPNPANSAPPEPGSSDRVAKYPNCSPSEAINAASPDSGANALVVDPKIKIGDQKVVRSSKTDENVGVGEEDEKGKARLVRNREYAHLSRQRKKRHVEELKDQVRSMGSTIAKLNCNILFLMAENANLRQQSNGTRPPMGPMPYPWMPCVVKAQGSQVPLVPIPRLETASASKPKKPEPKKAEGKSKNP